MRWNTNTDTPLPPDEPTAPNPPDGAIINYYLKSRGAGPVTLEIVGSRTGSWCASTRAPIRSADAGSGDQRRCRSTGIRAAAGAVGAAGMHRFIWDVHYQPLPAAAAAADAAACRSRRSPHNTVPAPTTPWVKPGTTR